MRRRANVLDYTRVMVKGVPALFTDARIERESVPDGFYLYEVRYDDENLGDPAQIGKCVIVNFLGSLLVSEEPIQTYQAFAKETCGKGLVNAFFRV